MPRKQVVGTTWPSKGADFRPVPFARLCVRRAPRGSGGPRAGAQYDLSHACKACGTGAIQLGPLRVRKSDLPTKGTIFETRGGELLVAQSLKDALERAHVTGAELRQVLSKRDNDLLPWYQLMPTMSLPPMVVSASAVVRSRPCTACDRDGYFDDGFGSGVLRYGRNLDFKALPDIVRTYEHFGNSRIGESPEDCYFQQPLIVMRSRLVPLFENDAGNAVEFVPLEQLA